MPDHAPITTSHSHSTATTDPTIEPQRVITVRIPESLHTLVKEGAHRSRTSMNLYAAGAIEDRLRAAGLVE